MHTASRQSSYVEVDVHTPHTEIAHSLRLQTEETVLYLKFIIANINSPSSSSLQLTLFTQPNASGIGVVKKTLSSFTERGYLCRIDADRKTSYY